MMRRPYTDADAVAAAAGGGAAADLRRIFWDGIARIVAKLRVSTECIKLRSE